MKKILLVSVLALGLLVTATPASAKLSTEQVTEAIKKGTDVAKNVMGLLKTKLPELIDKVTTDVNQSKALATAIQTKKTALRKHDPKAIGEVVTQLDALIKQIIGEIEAIARIVEDVSGVAVKPFNPVINTKITHVIRSFRDVLSVLRDLIAVLATVIPQVIEMAAPAGPRG